MQPFEYLARPDQTFHDLDDIPKQRQLLFDQVRTSLANKQVENQGWTLSFEDVDYRDAKEYRIKDEKKAKNQRRSLTRALQGRAVLKNPEGQIVEQDEKPRTILAVPYMTRRGTYIHNGTEYSVNNQQRLLPGIYTRKKDNGEVESQVNVKPGTGRAFRIAMDPAKAVFSLQIGQSRTKLYPVLKDLGWSDKDLKEVWGDEIYQANVQADDKTDRVSIKKALVKLGGERYQDVPEGQAGKALAELMSRMRVDPETTRRTIGKPIEHIDGQTLLDTTQKILRVNRGEDKADNREAQVYQQFLQGRDIMSEHIDRDHGGILRTALWKARRRGLKALPNGALNPQMTSVLLDSGLGAAVTQVNPLEVLDVNSKVNRMGEGAIGSTQGVARSARAVDPSHMGFIDMLRAPESAKAGLDLRLAHGVRRGDDGKLYQVVKDKEGNALNFHAGDFADNPIALPGEFAQADQNGGFVTVMDGGELKYMKAQDVQYELPDQERLFARTTNFVPRLEGIKGQRTIMGARMAAQALSLVDPQAPLVRSTDLHSKSWAESLGREMGARFYDADAPAKVLKIDPNEMTLMTPQGKTVVDLYNHLPHNQKSFTHNTPVVKVGDVVQPGQLLAKSNFTDGQGHAALGTNARVGYLPMGGKTHEDAVVISESMAKRLRSQHMYRHVLERGDQIDQISRTQYQAKYGHKFDKRQFDQLDDQGVVKPGTVVQPGDPLILAVGKRSRRVKGSVVDSPKSNWMDKAEIWESDYPGRVVDVEQTARGWRVNIAGEADMKDGDKLSAGHGNKGVVRVVPDEDMPADARGRPLEVVMNSMGINSRGNPGTVIEAALGKAAEATGQRYDIRNLSADDQAQLALDELTRAGLTDTEDLVDQKSGAIIPEVFTGVQHFYKLYHTAGSGVGARTTGGYTADGQPAKGGPEGAKRIGMLETASLLSAGASNIIADAKLMRGQRNDELQQAFRQGGTIRMPKISRQYERFTHHLEGAGIHLRKRGTQTQLLPQRDSDIKAMTGTREITNSGTVDFDTGDPEKGGLFDLALTGGADGKKWSYIQLDQPMPNPVMETPIRQLLGITGPQLKKILNGETEYRSRTGGQALQYGLSQIDLGEEIAKAQEVVRTSRGQKRDQAAKRLSTMQSLERNGVKPEELMISRVPVIPPAFRPISRMEGVELSADANYLYKELIEARDNDRDARALLADQSGGSQVYESLKGVMGFGNPVTKENQDRNVRGLLKQVLGSQPKNGIFQRSVIGQAVDFTGRGVIIPEPDYHMDEIGIPRDMAWKEYSPFVVRRLKRQGMTAQQALKEVGAKSRRAEKALLEEMEHRPIIANRAPSLHRHNLTAHNVRIVPGNAIRLPIPVLAGLGADFDGDKINVHVPIDDKAVKDAREKLMPSQVLRTPKDFKAHMKPEQGFIMGLYEATRHKDDKLVTPRTFKDMKELEAALRSGEITPDSRVTVQET